VRFLYDNPGSDCVRRELMTVTPTFHVDPGHAWRPPFGVQRVGQLAVTVQFSAAGHPPPPHWLAACRDGREVERRALELAGSPPFTVRASFQAVPAPEEIVLFAQDAAGHAVERGRWQVERPAFEADAEAVADPLINPVDLGAILPPADWLVLGPRQRTNVTVAAFSAASDLPGTEAVAWFGSALHVAVLAEDGRELWHEEITTMLVAEPPALPAFGAIETKLRYDHPILAYAGPDSVTEIPYEKAWPPERQDVVVSLPNGSRFVFWRGAAYTPFWAGKHNTGPSAAGRPRLR
jgi:hypothetical protein